MNLLALDTATENCSAALLIEGALHSREQRQPRAHAELILPMIAALLEEGALSLRDLSAIAFGRGPGAFTGVRLAASVTQGLAFGARLPVVPVSDLRALAQRVLDTDLEARFVLVCNDARMQEVYWGCFERDAQRLAQGLGAERLDRPGAVRMPGSWGAAGSLVRAAGSGFAAYPELREVCGLRAEFIHETLLPRAAEIARLAIPEVQAGRVLPAAQALPVYLRDDVARQTAPAAVKSSI